MTLDGYTARDVVPAEDASGGKAIGCGAAPPSGLPGGPGGRGRAPAAPARTEPCTASTKFGGAVGWYTLSVEYFDQSGGVSRYRVFINQQLVDEWSADLAIPSFRMDSSSSTRRTISGIALRPGDEIRIEGKPNGAEQAGLDYIEIEKM
jgi:alpha-glucuronidase